MLMFFFLMASSPETQPELSLHAQAARGSAWSLLSQLGTHGITLLVWAVLGRNIAPAEIGIVAFAQLIIAFLMIFLEQGFSDALVRRKAIDRSDEDTVFWTTLGMGGILAGIINLLAGPIAAMQGEPQLEPLLRGLSAAFPLMAFRVVPEALLLRGLRMRDLAIRTVVSTMIAAGVACSLAMRGFGAWSLVVQALVHMLGSALLLWWRSGWRPGISWSSERFREYLHFGAHITGANVFAYFNRRFDQWMVNIHFGGAALGYYQMSQRWVDLPYMLVTQGAGQVALTAFARVQEDRERLARGWIRASGVILAVAAFTSALLAATAPDLLAFLVGPNWAESAPILAVIAIAMLFQPINFLATRTFVAVGRPELLLRVNIFPTVINTVAVVVAASYGPIGIAVAGGVRIWTTVLLTLWIVHRLLRPNWKDFVRMAIAPLFPAVLTGGLVCGLRTLEILSDWPLIVRLLICALAGLLAYSALLWIMARETLREILFLLRRCMPGEGAQRERLK